MRFDHKSGEHLAVDGANIYYEISGDEHAPTLLFLHGGFGNMEDFNHVIADLEKTFRIIGIDSRGQGRSTLGGQVLTYERLQNDVLRVLDHLNVVATSIVGFSDGGIVAYRLAALTSLHIEKLITIGSRWRFKDVEARRELLTGVTSEGWKQKFPDTYEMYQRLNPEPDFDRLTESLVGMWIDPDASGYPNEAIAKIS